MKIIIQEKKLDKHTRDLLQEEVSLDNDDFENAYHVRLIIGDEASVTVPVADLLTAIEAFHRHQVRDDEEQERMLALERR